MTGLKLPAKSCAAKLRKPDMRSGSAAAANTAGTFAARSVLNRRCDPSVQQSRFTQACLLQDSESQQRHGDAVACNHMASEGARSTSPLPSMTPPLSNWDILKNQASTHHTTMLLLHNVVMQDFLEFFHACARRASFPSTFNELCHEVEPQTGV